MAPWKSNTKTWITNNYFTECCTYIGFPYNEVCYLHHLCQTVVRVRDAKAQKKSKEKAVRETKWERIRNAALLPRILLHRKSCLMKHQCLTNPGPLIMEVSEIQRVKKEKQRQLFSFQYSYLTSVLADILKRKPFINLQSTANSKLSVHFCSGGFSSGKTMFCW